MESTFGCRYSGLYDNIRFYRSIRNLQAKIFKFIYSFNFQRTYIYLLVTVYKHGFCFAYVYVQIVIITETYKTVHKEL
jgi:hypothetical protein